MFGYLRVMRPELKIKENNAYNAVYCGFCRTMGRYGRLLRLSLSYDFTFFSLLSLSLSPDFCGFENCRCPVKMFSKRPCVKQNEKLDYAADLAVLMLDAKLEDNLIDGEKIISSKLLKLYLKPKIKKISADLPKEYDMIKNYISMQKSAENEGLSIDKCCHPTAQLLSDFFSIIAAKDEQKEHLERLGYVLGRWIYLLDALDDLEDDIKKGSFNPLKSYGDIEKIKKECESDLNVCISEACDSLNKIELYNFKTILQNIVFLGLKNTQNIILTYSDKNKRKRALNGKSI